MAQTRHRKTKPIMVDHKTLLRRLHCRLETGYRLEPAGQSCSQNLRLPSHRLRSRRSPFQMAHEAPFLRLAPDPCRHRSSLSAAMLVLLRAEVAYQPAPGAIWTSR
jgi:hypothetical protein